MSERCGVCFLVVFFSHIHARADGGGTVICLVWCVCTWTDLWRKVALKTDQVMEKKLEAPGFTLGWFMRCMSHMMVSAKGVGPTPAICLPVLNDYQ